jgi:membrane-associated phospholipid phosphatase
VLALLKNHLSSSCRWCDTSSGGADGLNGFDRWGREGLKWSDTTTAATLSDVAAFAVMPVFALSMDLGLTGSHGRWRRWAMDLLMIADAAAISGGVNYIVKYAVSRQRPYVHYEVINGVSFQTTADDNASFFSSHTTFAFAVASSAGMVASLRHYRLAPVVWVVGVGLATFCGYLRVAADAHYLSDVIVGGVVGSAVGVTVPLMRWIRPLREQNISLSSQATTQGALFSIGGGF